MRFWPYTVCVLRLVRRLTAAVALLLLVWTVADLAFVQCCLHEQRMFADEGTAAGSAQSPQAGDDCFCCARCIDTAVRVQPLEHSAVWTDFADPVRHLAARSAVIDHPPQHA
jgi:hypothetical protein